MKNITHIPFTQIDSIPKLIKDYLEGDLEAYSAQRFSLENFAKQIEKKKNSFSNSSREILSEVLFDQHKELELSEKQTTNLELIKGENTFTVVTGHQLNLFTGPVFFVYKILQTLKTAEFLKVNFPQYNFVPLFWLASEDHDFEEINHFKTRDEYYELKAKSGGAVGRIEVEEPFFIHEFQKQFEHSIYGTELIRWMKEAYEKGTSLTDATKTLVNRLFSVYGLLMVDGDEHRLKKAMISTFKEELESEALFQHSKKEVETIVDTYGKAQVNPREINLFYLSSTRNRIQSSPEGFVIVDTELKFTKEELFNELEKHPERFSPNALMRPVYQEMVLPNLAYIGGNAEIMYWMELKSYFQHLSLDFPLLIPRNSFLMISEKTLGKIERMDLHVSDFYKNFAQVVNRKFLVESQVHPTLTEQKERLIEGFETLKSRAFETDKTFLNLVLAEEKRQLRSFDKMEKRLLRAEKIKHHEKLDRLEQLFLEVHPGENWQERVFNFSVFYSEFGRDWLQNCYLQMEVEKSGVNILMI